MMIGTYDLLLGVRPSACRVLSMTDCVATAQEANSLACRGRIQRQLKELQAQLSNITTSLSTYQDIYDSDSVSL